MKLKTVESFVESYPISNMFVIDGEKILNRVLYVLRLIMGKRV